MKDFNADLNKVLRYSMDSVENMLTQLKSPDHNHTRWADGHPTADHTFRGVLADAIEESDRPHRHKEAALLRKAGQHILVDGDGRIRPANFTESHIAHAVHELCDHTEDWSNGMWERPAIDWRDVSGRPEERAEFEEDQSRQHPKKYRHPYGTVEVDHLPGDFGDYGSRHHIHYSELGHHLADVIEDEVNRADYGWNTEPGMTEDGNDDPDLWSHRSAEFDRLVDGVKKAPYEEVDLGHTSERDNGFGFAMHHNEL